MSTFTLYIIGFVVMVIGLILGGVFLGLPAQWLIVGALVLVGLGVVTGATQTKRKDPPET